MNKHLEDKKMSLILLIISFATYTIIGFTRNAYAAAIAGIVEEGYFTKVDSGIIMSSFNITYCLSQIIGSYFVDKISPFKIISAGVIVTIFANIAMSISPTFWVIFIARGLCGIAQFGIWPSLLKIVAEYVNDSYRRKWMYIMPLGITCGNIVSYLIAALVNNWRDLFALSYILLAISIIAFIVIVFFSNKKAVDKLPVVTNETKKASTQNSSDNIGLFKLMISSGAILLIIPTVAKSLINAGINSWMPTMIMESYNVSSGFSSTLTALSTCANLAAVLWVVLLYPKIFKLPTTMVGILFLFSLPLLIILSFIGHIPLILVVILITLINTFKNSIHQFSAVEIPAAYTKYNKAGMVAGIINAFATFSGVIANILYGYTAENFGWNVTVISWGVLALIGLIFSFITTPIWKKFWNIN